MVVFLLTLQPPSFTCWWREELKMAVILSCARFAHLVSLHNPPTQMRLRGGVRVTSSPFTASPMGPGRASFSADNCGRGSSFLMHDTKRTHLPAFRTRYCVVAYVPNEQMDVPFNHKRLHAAVCSSTPEVHRSVRNPVNICGTGSNFIGRIRGTPGERGDLQGLPWKGGDGFLLSVLPSSKENGRFETHSRFVFLQQMYNGMAISYANNKMNTRMRHLERLVCFSGLERCFFIY